MILATAWLTRVLVWALLLLLIGVLAELVCTLVIFARIGWLVAAAVCEEAEKNQEKGREPGGSEGQDPLLRVIGVPKIPLPPKP